ncbi:MAG TPA: carbamoyltransferase HypF [Cyclobacteriaceae bacterium]|nr:carbamoyltransferase HypF [Cyclobacteriaceae bacterium]
MPTYHVHIEGQVQGVGFRPHIYRMARRLGLNGWVSNGADGVHVEISGFEDLCNVFINELKEQRPHLARITNQQTYLIENPGFHDFEIRNSTNNSKPNLLLTPDLGLCEDCRKEIKNSLDRRYEYAFTTCINCGPRYSIVKSLPYDRENTSMQEFEMCPSCNSEYNNPENRRYYSQTNSCPACGVDLILTDRQGKELHRNNSEILDRTIDLLHQGKIIAVKGIGGFILMTDATNANAIQTLRERKHRPTKPFALLYPSAELIQQDAVISGVEEHALKSIESPIVLLNVCTSTQSEIAIEQIAPGLNRIGVMLPYTPLLELLAGRWKKPLIATSGNVSGSPIFYEDEKAFQNLDSIADYFLTNNRDIIVPQDDSVIQFTNDHHRIVLRRSRGYAPTYLPNPFREKQTVFAAGGELKSTFALLHQGNLYLSQYLGDLENFETQENYRHTMEHLLQLFKAKPNVVLVDSHPSYYSTQLGNELSATWEVPVVKIQHHLGHFSAVLAENDLLQNREKILGVIWDGTGWGDDGNIWGGEFFAYDKFNFSRIAHLDYFDHLLGDKFSREPRLCALSLCSGNEAEELLKAKFTETEWNLYTSALRMNDNLKTSSVGRLFDGVASLLGLCDKSNYEGEAALYLEACAENAGAEISNDRANRNFSLSDYLKGLVHEINNNTPKEILAYRFHVALVNWIEEVAIRGEFSMLAFSGGVFQNALLVELIHKRLGYQYQLFFHQQLSPNDECIAFGQLAYHEIQHLRVAFQQKLLKQDLLTEPI